MTTVYYTVYKVTQIESGRYYIGAHKTTDLDDGYMGSGLIIKRALSKYGMEAFTKEYLAIFDNEHEMFMCEAEIITDEVLSDPLSYNLKEGGHGGFRIHNQDSNYRWARQKGAVAANTKRPGNIQWHENLSKAQYRRWQEPGRKEKFREQNLGEKNPAHGKVWIKHLDENRMKFIPKEELDLYMSQGWIRGRIKLAYRARNGSSPS